MTLWPKWMLWKKVDPGLDSTPWGRLFSQSPVVAFWVAATSTPSRAFGILEGVFILNRDRDSYGRKNENIFSPLRSQERKPVIN